MRRTKSNPCFCIVTARYYILKWQDKLKRGYLVIAWSLPFRFRISWLESQDHTADAALLGKQSFGMEYGGAAHERDLKVNCVPGNFCAST